MPPDKLTRRARYLRAVKRDKVIVGAARTLLLIALLALWEGAAMGGLIDPFIFSSPSRILRTTLSLLRTGNLLMHILVSLWETLLGFVLGVSLGVFFAVVMWWFPRVGRVLDPYLVILNSLPKIALGPVLIVWMGTGMTAIVTIAVLVSVVVAISGIYSGFLEVSEAKITLMRSFGASRWQILTMLVLPANVPTVITALKLSVGMSWVGVIVGEFLISRAGLGYLIVYGGQVFKLDIVMASVTILCALAGGMYFLVALLERAIRKARA